MLGVSMIAARQTEVAKAKFCGGFFRYCSKWCRCGSVDPGVVDKYACSCEQAERDAKDVEELLHVVVVCFDLVWLYSFILAQAILFVNNLLC